MTETKAASNANNLTVLTIVIGLMMSAATAIWWTSSTSTQFSQQMAVTTERTAQLRTDFAAAVATLKAETVERMDRSEAEAVQRRVSLYARLDADERDTKAAAAFINQVDVRLSRMEAQLDLVVKNMTAASVIHR